MEQGEVAQVTLARRRGRRSAEATASRRSRRKKGDRFRTRIPDFGDDSLLALLEKTGVEVEVEEPEDDLYRDQIEGILKTPSTAKYPLRA